jgi:hypothetical protein
MQAPEAKARTETTQNQEVGRCDPTINPPNPMPPGRNGHHHQQRRMNVNEQPERLAFRTKAEALRARLDAAKVKLEAIEAKRDAAEQVWHQACADFQAEMAAFRAERAVIEAEAAALGEERKHLPPKPADVARIDPPATPGSEGQD